jgi:tetratricopeptide (TPR) repeat protein
MRMRSIFGERQAVYLQVRLALCVSLLTFLSGLHPCRASALTDEGMQLYNAGQFQRSGSCFLAEIQANPTNASAHYLLGNVYTKLNRKAEAISEYQKASTLEPNDSVGQYSRAALAALLKNTGAPKAAVQSDAVDAETKSSAQAISQQTNEKEGTVSAECQAKIKSVNDVADGKVKQLEKEMEEQIAANGSAITVVGYGGPFLRSRYTRQVYNPAEANAEIRAEYEPKIQAVRDQARKEIDQITAAYKQRQAALESSAVTMDMSLLNKKNAAVKMVPSGTNLYTRSYQSDGEATGNAVPTLAVPKSLNDTVKKNGQ